MKKYSLITFETFASAKLAKEDILKACQDCDQLNLLVKEEGNMDDQDLLQIHPKVKIFAGAAWTIIHERRVVDGWYEAKH